MRRCSGYSNRLAGRRAARAILGAALLFLLLMAPGAARAQARSERDIKCLLFVTLARYTQWPTNAFPSETAPFVIGVLGQDPFAGLLESMTKNEKVRDRPIVVRRYSSGNEIERCHAVFFGGMSILQRDLELSRLRRRNILTVSDAAGFAREGGMVEMYVNDENKVRLRVSKGAVRQGGLSISQTILGVADVVAVMDSIETADGWALEPKRAFCQAGPRRAGGAPAVGVSAWIAGGECGSAADFWAGSPFGALFSKSAD